MPTRPGFCFTILRRRFGAPGVAVRAALLGTALAFVPTSNAHAARPLLDKGQWDAYFAMFAPDVNVPWKTSIVRLDTYSGAPVDFAAYAVDPADVIMAGTSRTRAIDTAHRRPVVKWRYSPPGGLRFQANDVEVPLGSQEGFYVIEARRGDAVQQVWLNRTHIGLLSLESPEGLALWAVDLRTGRSLQAMSLDFLVAPHLDEMRTDQNGLVMWNERRRPTFALAESGAGRAFVSFLPQAQLPNAIVGIRLESAVVRSGRSLRFAGFARHRAGGVLRCANGEVHVTLAHQGRTLASTAAKLDGSGAFNGTLSIPEGLADGDYTVLANAGGTVGGETVHVDAGGDLELGIGDRCPCDPGSPVRVTVVATRAGDPASGVSIHLRVVRSPHVVPPGSSEDAPRWGTTVVLDEALHTDETGRASFNIPNPTDGLDSSYGIRATTQGASATTRVVVPNARVALAITPVQTSVDVGQSAGFDVFGFDAADGAPASELPVRLRLSHGSNVQTQDVTLDARGRAHSVFRDPSLGANLILAEADVDGRRALDASALVVEPRALSQTVASEDSGVSVTLDRARYRQGEHVTVRASAAGASGQALFALVGAKTYALRVAGVRDGTAVATLDLGDPQGDVRILVAFVRNGAISLGSAPVTIDGVGRARETSLSLVQTTVAAGGTVQASVRDAAERGGTLVVRVADGVESAPALFDDAPGILANGGTTAQNPAADNATWHAYVTPARSTASDIFAAEAPRKVPTDIPTLGAAAPRTLFWRVEPGAASFDIPAPLQPGHYVLSILRVSADGDVGASSAGFVVQ